MPIDPEVVITSLARAVESHQDRLENLVKLVQDQTRCISALQQAAAQDRKVYDAKLSEQGQQIISLKQRVMLLEGRRG